MYITLLMVDNYLPAFDMDEQRAMDKHVDEQLAGIKADISARRQYIEPVTDTDRELHANYERSYEAKLPGGTLSGLVYATDRCIGCGVCSRVCPGGCIRIEDGRAQFDYTSCQACLACAPRLHAEGHRPQDTRGQSRGPLQERACHS